MKYVQYNAETGFIGAVVISSREIIHPSQLVLEDDVITDGKKVNAVRCIL